MIIFLKIRRIYEIQGFRASGLQGFRASGLQGFRASGLQGFRALSKIAPFQRRVNHIHQ